MERRPLPRPVVATGYQPADRQPNIVRKPTPPILAILLGPPKSFITHFHFDPAVQKRISRGCYGEGCTRCQLAKPHTQHYAPLLVYRARAGGSSFGPAKRSPIESWDREILAIPHYSLGKFANERHLGIVVEISTHRDQLSIGFDPAGGPHQPAFPVPPSFDLDLALTRFFFPEEWQAAMASPAIHPATQSEQPTFVPSSRMETTR